MMRVRRNKERPMKILLSRFARDARGATAIEYALISMLIALAIVTALTYIGTQLSSQFSEVGNALK
jgi:pilus assembly protein Flp/PilA